MSSAAVTAVKTRNQSRSSYLAREQLYLFIEDTLTKKLARDLRSFRIVSESDMQSVIYYHLRKKLRRDTGWKVWNKYYMRREYGGRVIFRMYPDIVILRHRPRTKAEPRIVLELKEKKSLDEKAIKADASKLRMLLKRRLIKRGYLLYLCRQTDGKPETELQEQVRKWLPRKKKYAKKIVAIVINAYDHIPKNKRRAWAQYWKQSARYRA